MLSLEVIKDAAAALADLRTKSASKILDHRVDQTRIVVSPLLGGMESGKAAVQLRIDLPTGQTVLAVTSADLFVTAGRAIAVYTGQG